MAELWDDAALVTAFNDALNKYEVKHKKKKTPKNEPEADASVVEEAADEEEVSYENVQEKDQQSSQAEDQQQEHQQQSYSWDSYYQQLQQQFPYPYPYAAYPFPPAPPMFYPVFPGFQAPGNQGPYQPAASGSTPSYESLKAAVLKALSELPADKKLTLEENSNSTEVLLAWFNAGFRTASYLAK